jgi:hypothetical protein
MSHADYRDLYDAGSDIRVRVSTDVLSFLGPDRTFELARRVRARDPHASRPKALAVGYEYTVNGVEVVVTVFLLRDRSGRVPVFRISSRREWEAFHAGLELLN